MRSHSELPFTILRPSIVVGDRNNGWTSAFNVLYWPLRAFAARPVHGGAGDPVGAGRRRLGRLRRRRRSTRCASPSRGIGATYHLTAGARRLARSPRSPAWPAATSAGRCPQVLPPAEFAALTLGAAERSALDAGSEYFPYFSMDGVFDDARHPRAAGAATGSPPRRCATTWTGCWTSPRAAAGASARSPASTRSPTTRTAARPRRSAPHLGALHRCARGSPAAVAAPGDHAILGHRHARRHRALSPRGPRCARHRRRWPARSACAPTTWSGRTAWRATIHRSNAVAPHVRRRWRVYLAPEQALRLGLMHAHAASYARGPRPPPGPVSASLSAVPAGSRRPRHRGARAVRRGALAVRAGRDRRRLLRPAVRGGLPAGADAPRAHLPLRLGRPPRAGGRGARHGHRAVRGRLRDRRVGADRRAGAARGPGRRGRRRSQRPGARRVRARSSPSRRGWCARRWPRPTAPSA